MAHFAELDENNIVLRVIVVDNGDTADEDGNEVEAIGITFCENLLGGTWLQTSYNNNIRKKFAGIGLVYDSNFDEFLDPQRFPSWQLDDNHDWQPPTPRPDDGPLHDKAYDWDEDSLSWLEASES
jgi:hypothetical protein